VATVAKFTWTGVNFSNQTVLNGAARGSGTVLPPIYMGVGTGTTAAAVTDTALQTELTSGTITPATYTRATGTLSIVTTAQTNDTLVNTATYTLPANAPANEPISEVGLFDTATGATGNMWFRATFTALSLTPGMGLLATCSAQGSTS
jgi:N-acetylglutamate synthase/N-acetylornithine aminotransferase